MTHDFSFALRQMRRNMRFHLLTAATLALGIGLTTSIFSLVSVVLLRALPFPQPNRLVALQTLQFPAGFVGGNHPVVGSPTDTSYPDFFDWRNQNQTLEGVATYSYPSSRKFTPGRGRAPQIIEGVFVSAEFFQVIGVLPQYGRAFNRDDEMKGVCSIILSHELWEAEFGGSPVNIGGPIRMSDKPCTVIGVMPPGFSFPYQESAPKFWGTFAVLQGSPNNRLIRRGDRDTNVVARLRRGISASQASAELSAIQRRLAASFAEDRNYFAVAPLLETITGDVRKPLLLLFCSVTGVLLIACVNAVGLLLARGITRRSEFSVRIALGASRAQIIRQVLIESTILSCLAGIGGVALAFVFLKVFSGIVPGDLPGLQEVRTDRVTLAFSFLVSVITGICFGVLPAWSASRADASLALGRGRAVSRGTGEQRLHGGLVIAEIAISLVLLAGSGVLIRSFVETMQVKPGFDPHGLLTFRLGMSLVEFPQEKSNMFFRELQSKLFELPGVVAVTAAYPIPFTYDNMDTFQLQGLPYDPSDPLSAKIELVQPHYFEALKVPLLVGRTFSERDDGHAKRVAIVDEEFARSYFPKGDAIGKSLRPDAAGEELSNWCEIVGVVGSIRTTDLTEKPGPQFFLPYEQTDVGPQGMILRVNGDPRTYEGVVRAAVGKLNRDVPIFDMNTMDERVANSTVYARFEAQLLTCFAIAALLLAAVGLYATLSEMVARRTFEIGVRVAVGAQRIDVFRLILKRGLAMALIGVMAGVAGFWVAMRLFAEMLYNVSSFDPWTIFVASAVLVCVSLLASAGPAWRAVGLDPMEALRDQ